MAVSWDHCSVAVKVSEMEHTMVALWVVAKAYHLVESSADHSVRLKANMLADLRVCSLLAAMLVVLLDIYWVERSADWMGSRRAAQRVPRTENAMVHQKAASTGLC